MDEENDSVALWVVAAGHQLKGVARASAKVRDPSTLKCVEWPWATGHRGAFDLSRLGYRPPGWVNAATQCCLSSVSQPLDPHSSTAEM